MVQVCPPYEEGEANQEEFVKKVLLDLQLLKGSFMLKSEARFP